MDKLKHLRDRAKQLNISIRYGKSCKDRAIKAVHILDPTINDLEDAIEQCIDEHLDFIYIYTRQTWSNNRRNQLFNY